MNGARRPAQWARGARNMQRRMLAMGWSALTAGTVLLVGCSQVPTTGPVQQVSPAVSHTQENGVRIDAEAPREGASPELIVAGYLNAMASLQPDFTVARQYLTPEAQQKWNPMSGTTVVDAATERITSTTTSGFLSAPVVGRLDAQGRYTVADDALNVDFGLTKVSGQWRIDQPPQGLVITSRVFHSSYLSMQRYFLSADGSTMVPETLRVASVDFTPTRAITALLAGPSRWLRGAVLTALPPTLKLADSSITVSTDGLATVNFDASVTGLDAVAKQRIVTQVVWTLSQFAQIESVRFAAKGQPLQVPQLLDAQGRISTSDPLPASPKTWTQSQFFVLANGKLGEVAATGSAVLPVTDWRAKLPLAGADTLTLAEGGQRVIWTGQGRMWLATANGSKVLIRARQFGSPQAMPDNTVWNTALIGDRWFLVRIGTDGRTASFPLGALPAGMIASFSVAPDPTRVAVSIRNGQTTSVGLVSIGRGAAAAGQGWLPTPVVSSGSPITMVTGIGWSGSDDFMVLGATKQGQPVSVYQVSDDSADVSAVGPANGVKAEEMQVVTTKTGASVILRTAGGDMLSLAEPWRWFALAHGISTMSITGK